MLWLVVVAVFGVDIVFFLWTMAVVSICLSTCVAFIETRLKPHTFIWIWNDLKVVVHRVSRDSTWMNFIGS